MANIPAEAPGCDMDFLSYIKGRKWSENSKTERKQFLLRLAQNSKNDPDFAGKIGGILIYNQLIEQFLADIVQISIFYIKAKIWPANAQLHVDMDKATFGKMIEYFQRYATIEPNQREILTQLKRFNTKRNQIVHDLFDVEDLKKLYHELSDYAMLADEIIFLLNEYDNAVCRNFCQLEQTGVFKKLPSD